MRRGVAAGWSSLTNGINFNSLLRLRTNFGERAFSHAGPVTWNALPDHIRTMAGPVNFRKLLKSHYLFKLLTFVDFVFFLSAFWLLADFCKTLVKLGKMLVTVIALKYALLVS